MDSKILSSVWFAIGLLSLCAIAYGEEAAYFSSKKAGVVQKNSGHLTKRPPDVCKTPSPAGPIPVPYPTIKKGSDTAKGSKKVKIDGTGIIHRNSYSPIRSEDEPGVADSQEIKRSKSRQEAQGVVFQ